MMIRMEDRIYESHISNEAERLLLRGRGHMLPPTNGPGAVPYFEIKQDARTLGILNDMLEDVRKTVKGPLFTDRPDKYKLVAAPEDPELVRIEGPVNPDEEPIVLAIGTLHVANIDGEPVAGFLLTYDDADDEDVYDERVVKEFLKRLKSYKEPTMNERKQRMELLNTILDPGNYRSRRANLGNAAPGRKALPENVARLIKEYAGETKNLRDPVSRLVNKTRRANKKNTNKKTWRNRLFGRRR